MIVKNNTSLADYTSFGVGGNAEKLIIVDTAEEFCKVIKKQADEHLWVIGYGTNILVSEKGLPGTTILTHGGKIEQYGLNLIVDSGVWWDDLVIFAIQKGLWGIELMSGIPGGVGGAVFININAYGQSMSDSLEWVEAMDSQSQQIKRHLAKDLPWSYKQSVFQSDKYQNQIILRASFKLSNNPTCELTYQKALDVAEDLKIKPSDLQNRRAIILEARARAGSIYSTGQGHEKTVGSFFKNPLVTKEQAELVIGFDESGKTKEQVLAMNRVHGGSEYRVSAAHVLLASGFSRGQSWGGVRLHPKNLLKIENYNSASAQDIYEVSKLITDTVKNKLNISLEHEARLLGVFD